MSDETTNDQPTEATEQQQGDPAEAPLGEGGIKALQAERERARELEKQLGAATARLTEIERANESALDRAQREAQEAKEYAAKATAEALRFRVAAEYGISENVDLILTAGDEDTMRKQADLWSQRAAAPAAPGTPLPDPSVGVKSGGPKSNGDVFASLISEHFTR